jgi:hypothetical protein
MENLERLMQCGFQQQAVEASFLLLENMSALSEKGAAKYPFVKTAVQFGISESKAGVYRTVRAVITGSSYPVCAPNKIGHEIKYLCDWI